jgi:hypothetical protein
MKSGALKALPALSYVPMFAGPRHLWVLEFAAAAPSAAIQKSAPRSWG